MLEESKLHATPTVRSSTLAAKSRTSSSKRKPIQSMASLRSHLDSVRDVAVCGDNNFFVSASEDCVIKLWSF